MSRKRQAALRSTGARSTDPEDYQRVPRAVAAMPKDFAAGHEIAPHRHARAQLIYATVGTMRVSTDAAVWVVPPQRALWMPAGIRHSITMSGDVTMRTLYLRHDAAAGMPEVCRVLQVSPLLRELIVRATELPMHYDERGAAGHVVALILDELHHEQSLPLHLPMPRDRRLRRLCTTLLEQPGDPRTLEEWAHSANASPRTLARLFVAETGLTFGAWRQQARVLEAMGRLGGGQAVTEVALDLGYDSVSAFSAMFRRASGVSPSAYRPSR
ncbi:helix-turn-helix transcriptional regulator [Reyranella sp.]|uniref:AraC family transcriptional regulator n=1 Tax=Reyranella sp. TaxID=1929291 RepID=UPI0025E3EFEF|nr:helix-turn-helix transcriptional regulator [Reyranella sp.]